MFPMICWLNSYDWFFHSMKQSEKKQSEQHQRNLVFLVFLWLISRVPTGPQISPSFSHFLLSNYGFEKTNHLFSRSMCGKNPETTWVDVLKQWRIIDGDLRWFHGSWTSPSFHPVFVAGEYGCHQRLVFWWTKKMSLNFMGELKIDQPGSMSWACSHNHERNKGKCFLEDVYIYI